MQTFHLECDLLPHQLWRALPSTLFHLKLSGNIKADLSEPISNTEAITTCLKDASWLPNLKSFTYRPDANHLIDDMQAALERFEDNVDIEQFVSEVQTYLGELESLEKGCHARNVILNCELIGKLCALAENMLDSIGDEEESDYSYEQEYASFDGGVWGDEPQYDDDSRADYGGW